MIVPFSSHDLIVSERPIQFWKSLVERSLPVNAVWVISIDITFVLRVANEIAFFRILFAGNLPRALAHRLEFGKSL